MGEVKVVNKDAAILVGRVSADDILMTYRTFSSGIRGDASVLTTEGVVVVVMVFLLRH